MDALDIKDVEVQGTLSVRPYNVRQRVPKLTGLIQLDKIKEAINAIKARDNLKLLANWPDYGCATYVHASVLASVLEARNRLQLVQFPLDWIERVERHINDVSPPFTDIMDKTKVS
eukprot:jgi/Phyca11/105211/e_gw1.10.792.1